MHGPWVTGWLLVAVSAAAGGYCLVRMGRCAGRERREAGEDALMGLGMAAMALPVLLDGAWTVYAVVFGGAALHALWSLRHRSTRHLHHLVGSLAMVYMALAMAPPATGHGGHPAAAGVPLVTGALLLYYAGYALLSGARLVPAAGAPAGVMATGPRATAPAGDGGDGQAGTGRAGGGRAGSGPGLAPACRLAMALGMLAMLLAL
ncbi:DUF5134 domain-containing protein [Streptomyces sp. NPDC000594]|uniref:DUF5134 domain-containing protein n=1 Tax=Streptomyces sp. NPDC000594 TaxID=3154261 RepID=UPI00331DC237